MFLLNSWLNHFTETTSLWYALSRSYSVNLPSSFSTAHPSALEYSSRLPVSVCGTGCISLTLEVFLGGMIRITIPLPKLCGTITFAISADLPAKNITTRFNVLFRKQRGLSLPRHPIETNSRCWNINQLSISYPFRVCLRTRLTLIRLTLIRNP